MYRRLNGILDNSSTAQQEVLRLSYSAGLSIRKISASTKISVGSIQNILKLFKDGFNFLLRPIILDDLYHGKPQVSAEHPLPTVFFGTPKRPGRDV